MIKHLKVLVVDDDQSILDVLATFLETKGYDVARSGNGEEALAVLRGDSFDLVISDIEMAGTNGFELLKAARSELPRIGIVLMTAYDDRYPLSQALRAGADGYISKPFSLKKFSLIFERAYWHALARQDWWDEHDDGNPDRTVP